MQCFTQYCFKCLNYLFYVSSDLTIPTIVVLNTSNQQYFLPDRHIENTEDMVQFINNILDGTAEVSLHCDLEHVGWFLFP